MSEAEFLSIDPLPLAAALRKARKQAGLTQADAAEIISAARTTITAIEKGERRVRAEELIALARGYGRPVSDLVRPRPEIESFRDRFSALPQFRWMEPGRNQASIDVFEEQCRNYLELEQLARAPLPQDYPLAYDIAGIDPEAAAEDVASAERNRLGIGEGPIPNLRAVLEGDVGLRIFHLPIEPIEYAAFYLYSEVLGACVALNARHSEAQRRWSLAREYGRFLVDRYRPAMLVEKRYEHLSKSEHFAESFAGHFLLPSSGLKRRFNILRRSNRAVTSADLGVIAQYYGVTIGNLTRRLESLRLLPTGSWDRLAQAGQMVREAKPEYKVEPISVPDDRLPIRYLYLAVSAHDRGLISEGQLAGFLKTDRLGARRTAETLRRQPLDAPEAMALELDLTRGLID